MKTNTEVQEGLRSKQVWQYMEREASGDDSWLWVVAWEDKASPFINEIMYTN